MRDIENQFQALADRILSGEISQIDEKRKSIVSDFYALWNIRAHHKRLKLENPKIEVLDLRRHFSVDEQECLEKDGITAIRPDMTLPGRNLTGVKIQINLLHVRKMLKDDEWGVLKASEGEFIVPDNFNNALIVPLTPSLCLYSPSKNDSISKEELISINRLALETSEEYCFARDLSKCLFF